MSKTIVNRLYTLLIMVPNNNNNDNSKNYYALVLHQLSVPMLTIWLFKNDIPRAYFILYYMRLLIMNCTLFAHFFFM